MVMLFVECHIFYADLHALLVGRDHIEQGGGTPAAPQSVPSFATRYYHRPYVRIAVQGSRWYKPVRSNKGTVRRRKWEQCHSSP